jgi:hypothetical protein
VILAIRAHCTAYKKFVMIALPLHSLKIFGRVSRLLILSFTFNYKYKLLSISTFIYLQWVYFPPLFVFTSRVYFLPVYRKGERGVADSIGEGVDHVDLVDPVPDLFWKGGLGGGMRRGVGVYIPSHLHLWYSHLQAC